MAAWRWRSAEASRSPRRITTTITTRLCSVSGFRSDMYRSLPVAALFVTMILTCCRQEQPKRVVMIGAAANLTDVFEQLSPQCEAQTGTHPVVSFASTAQLARQIENSAPFDAFFAADSEHVAGLEREGLLLHGSRAIYARGVLALWIPSASLNRIEDLSSPSVRVIAIAKPDLAPYGQAAVDALQRIGIWEQVKPRVVYAENISIAKQYR